MVDSRSSLEEQKAVLLRERGDLRRTNPFTVGLTPGTAQYDKARRTELKYYSNREEQINAKLGRIDEKLRAYQLSESSGLSFGQARRKVTRSKVFRDKERLAAEAQLTETALTKVAQGVSTTEQERQLLAKRRFLGQPVPKSYNRYRKDQAESYIPAGTTLPSGRVTTEPIFLGRGIAEKITNYDETVNLVSPRPTTTTAAMPRPDARGRFYQSLSPSTRRLSAFQYDAGTGVDQPKPDFYNEFRKSTTSLQEARQKWLRPGTSVFGFQTYKANWGVIKQDPVGFYRDTERFTAAYTTQKLLPSSEGKNTNKILRSSAKSFVPVAVASGLEKLGVKGAGKTRSFGEEFTIGLYDDFRNKPVTNALLFAAGNVVTRIGGGLAAKAASSTGIIGKIASRGSQLYTAGGIVLGTTAVGTIGYSTITSTNPGRTLGRETARLLSFGSGALTAPRTTITKVKTVDQSKEIGGLPSPYFAARNVAVGVEAYSRPGAAGRRLKIISTEPTYGTYNEVYGGGYVKIPFKGERLFSYRNIRGSTAFGRPVDTSLVLTKGQLNRLATGEEFLGMTSNAIGRLTKPRTGRAPYGASEAFAASGIAYEAPRAGIMRAEPRSVATPRTSRLYQNIRDNIGLFKDLIDVKIIKTGRIFDVTRVSEPAARTTKTSTNYAREGIRTETILKEATKGSTTQKTKIPDTSVTTTTKTIEVTKTSFKPTTILVGSGFQQLPQSRISSALIQERKPFNVIAGRNPQILLPTIKSITSNKASLLTSLQPSFATSSIITPALLLTSFNPFSGGKGSTTGTTTTPKRPNTWIPKLPFGPGGKISSGKNETLLSGSFAKKYSPSLAALAFNITAPAKSINTSGPFSGFELRPIITKTKRKKRARKA